MHSENNWPLIDASQLDKSPVPSTAVVPLPGTLGGDVGWLLRWVGTQFNNRVQPLRNPGCWGWSAPAYVPGSTVYSNHSSGTAIDFNAPSFPWRTYTMTAGQIAACRDIVNQTEGVVAWGGDFTTIVDQMHFEINGTSEEVTRIVNQLRGEDVERIQELEDLANHRQALLDKIGKTVSVPSPVDGNNVDQVIANIHTEQHRIDELTGVVGQMEQELKLKPGTLTKENVLGFLAKNLK